MRIKYGGGAGQNQSLQNYPHGGRRQCHFGEERSKRQAGWRSRARRPLPAPGVCPPPPPPLPPPPLRVSPRQMDMGQPCRAIWGQREPLRRECESREAWEIILLQNVTTSPHSPSGAPRPPSFPTCGLCFRWPFQELLSPRETEREREKPRSLLLLLTPAPL